MTTELRVDGPPIGSVDTHLDEIAWLDPIPGGGSDETHTIVIEDKKIVEAIKNGKRNGYSMGCKVDYENTTSK